VATSRTFQILYRNEEIRLGDRVLFKVHAIVESGKVKANIDAFFLRRHHRFPPPPFSSLPPKIEDHLERADFQLALELWYSEESSKDAFPFECVSSRILDLRLRPPRSLHHHLPVLFDYFHLSAVSVTVHAALVSLHQPYIRYHFLLPKSHGMGECFSGGTLTFDSSFSSFSLRCHGQEEQLEPRLVVVGG